MRPSAQGRGMSSVRRGGWGGIRPFSHQLGNKNGHRHQGLKAAGSVPVPAGGRVSWHSLCWRGVGRAGRSCRRGSG